MGNAKGIGKWGIVVCTCAAAVVCGVGAAWASEECETGKHIPDPGQANEWFGKTLAMTEDRAVIAAYHSQPGGSAFAYHWSGRGWEQEAELRAPDEGFGDSFGRGVDVRGTLAVVGAPDHDGTAERSGAAYVFERVAGEWTFVQKLLAADGDDVDQFGWSAAIAGDSIVVGARGDGQAGLNAGAIYIFQHDGSRWLQTQKLFETNATWAEGGSLGYCMASTEDRVVVGAPWHNGNGGNHGAALVFRELGGAWALEQRIYAPDSGQPETFGLSVDMSDRHVIVGAPARVVQSRGQTGAAFLYQWNGSRWSIQQGLLAADSAIDDHFGYSVALDGALALAGAYGNNDGFGSAHLFQLVGETWLEVLTLMQSDAQDPDPLGAPPWFGQALALAGDRALIGAPHDDNPNGGDAGATYAFSGLIIADCNQNGSADGCDIAEGHSNDRNGNGIPDECEDLCFREPEWVCDGDVDGNGTVNPVDVGLVQAAFCSAGDCADDDLCQYDLDCNAAINPVDAGIVQSLFGGCEKPRGVCP
jgi:hypothetical protein